MISFLFGGSHGIRSFERGMERTGTASAREGVKAHRSASGGKGGTRTRNRCQFASQRRAPGSISLGGRYPLPEKFSGAATWPGDQLSNRSGRSFGDEYQAVGYRPYGHHLFERLCRCSGARTILRAFSLLRVRIRSRLSRRPVDCSWRRLGLASSPLVPLRGVAVAVMAAHSLDRPGEFSWLCYASATF